MSLDGLTWHNHKKSERSSVATSKPTDDPCESLTAEAPAKRLVPTPVALEHHIVMPKKSKMSELKHSHRSIEENHSEKDIVPHKKHKSSKHSKEEEKINVPLNGSLIADSHKKQSRDYYEKLIECINEWYIDKKQKSKPEFIFRKHIPWKDIMIKMESKGFTVKDVNELKHHWFEVCKHIKVERPLTDILSESDQAIEKLFKIPTLSGYSIFQTEQRQRIKDKHPGLKFIEIHQKIAKRWNKLSDVQKQYYNNIAARENEKNGVGMEKSKKRKSEKLEKYNDITSIVENYNYPTTILKDFYVSVKAAEMKSSDPDLPYKKRRSIAALNFSKCSFEELTEIKKKYLDHLQDFINKVNSEKPELIAKIGQHIMETKRLRPLVEQPVISRFLSSINFSEAVTKSTKKSTESSPSSSPIDRKFNVIERYENSSLSSEELSNAEPDDNN